jgi:hypothetical protein
MSVGDPVVLIAAIIGALAGAVSFLFRQLVLTKNRNINQLTDERDFYRAIVHQFSKLPDGASIPDYDLWFQQQHPMPRGREPLLIEKPQE